MWSRNEKVKVVGHQDKRMYLNSKCFANLREIELEYLPDLRSRQVEPFPII
jgi:hypothetical protein